MSQNKKNRHNVATSTVNADALALNQAMQDMLQEGMEVATVETLTAEMPVASPVASPVATQDIKTAFVSHAVTLLSSRNVSSVPLSDVLASMAASGFTFAPKAETDKAPKSKAFALCLTEKTAGNLYKFLVNELRNKSSVMFTGTLQGKTLYYNSCNVVASSPLPVESVNAWKEAYKLANVASGK